jgi:hypothetical protein
MDDPPPIIERKSHHIASAHRTPSILGAIDVRRLFSVRKNDPGAIGARSADGRTGTDPTAGEGSQYAVDAPLDRLRQDVATPLSRHVMV